MIRRTILRLDLYLSLRRRKHNRDRFRSEERSAASRLGWVTRRAREQA